MAHLVNAVSVKSFEECVPLQQTSQKRREQSGWWASSTMVQSCSQTAWARMPLAGCAVRTSGAPSRYARNPRSAVAKRRTTDGAPVDATCGARASNDGLMYVIGYGGLYLWLEYNPTAMWPGCDPLPACSTMGVLCFGSSSAPNVAPTADHNGAAQRREAASLRR